MRNLKKVLAVVLTIALLASMMMVPALAAVSNEDEANALKAIGLFKGYGDDLGLTDKLTREQGMILVIRAMGAEEDALAMTEAEVEAELADVTDLDSIGTWAGARNYAAYALKAGLTKGVSTEKLVFGGQLEFAGDQLVILLLRAMGYTNVEKDNCWDLAVEAEFVSAGEAVALQLNNALIRDDAAGVLYSAVKNGVCVDGKPLIEKLIADGAVDEDAAAEAGFIEAEADTFEVVDVEATNLKEIVVTFSRDVNEDTVDEADFDVDGDTPDSVSVDGNVVVLTMDDADVLDNDTEYTLSVEDIEDLAENVIEDTEFDFTVKDVELPRLEDIIFTGPQTAKLVFSEPIDPSELADASVTVDDGIYSATFDSDDVDGNEVEVDLGTELEEGEHEFKVKGFKDYVPYVMITKTVDVEYVDVDEAPEITVKEATQTKVVLSFNRPVKGMEEATFYHTYSSWTPLSIEDKDGDPIVETDFYDEVTLRFTDNSDATTDRPLPEGTVKVVILAETDDYEIEDRWENNLDDDVELYVDITADNTPPAVKKIKVLDDQRTVKVYFTEEVTAASAEKAANVEIRDPDGDVIKSYDYTRELLVEDGDNYYLEIYFDDVREEGTYEITLSGIKDTSLAENVIKKVTLTFDIEDTTGISLADTVVTCVDDDDILYVAYDAAMNTSGSYSVLDPDNYQLNGADLDADDVRISKFTDKIVKIEFKEDVNLVGSTLTIARVKDAKGNLSQEIAWTSPAIQEEAGPVITAVKKVAENKFELTVNKEIKSVKASAIAIDANGDGTATTVASISFVNDDDDTIIKVTTNANDKHKGTAFDGDTELGGSFVIETAAGFIKSVTGAYMGTATYTFGDDLNGPSAGTGWKDGMAPKLVKIVEDEYGADTDDYEGEYKVYVSGQSGNLINEITLVYSEDLDGNSVSKYTYKVGGYTVKSATVDDNVVTLEIENDDDDETNDLDATPTVTQVYDIEDDAGNAFLAEDSVEAISYTEWVALID